MPGAARQPWSELCSIRLVRAPGLSPELVLLLRQDAVQQPAKQYTQGSSRRSRGAVLAASTAAAAAVPVRSYQGSTGTVQAWLWWDILQQDILQQD